MSKTMTTKPGQIVSLMGIVSPYATALVRSTTAVGM